MFPGIYSSGFAMTLETTLGLPAFILLRYSERLVVFNNTPNTFPHGFEHFIKW